MDEMEPLCTVGRIIKWYSHYGKRMQILQIIKNPNMIQQSHFQAYIQKNYNQGLEEVLVHPHSEQHYSQ